MIIKIATTEAEALTIPTWLELARVREIVKQLKGFSFDDVVLLPDNSGGILKLHSDEDEIGYYAGYEETITK